MAVDKGCAYDIENLLQKPYWVIDLLPSQVPADSEGQFFVVERVLLNGVHGSALRSSFARTLLMINCYHDFLVFRSEQEMGASNPEPAELERWVMGNQEGLNVVIPSEQALIAVPSDSTCMTLYNPSPQLLEEVQSIASANGLFVWAPPQL